MKKTIFIIIALVLAVSVFVLIGTFAARDSLGGNQKTEAENVIYIGVYEPLSGAYASGGLMESLGIRYAHFLQPTVTVNGVEYEVELVEKDSAEDSPEAPYGAQRLLSAGVCAVLGASSPRLTAAGLPVFEEAGLPVIGLSGSTEKLGETSSVYYRLGYSESFQNKVAANYAYGQDLRYGAVLSLTGDLYSKESARLFAEAFSALGGESVEFSLQLGQENFRSLLSEIKDSGADFVYLLSGPGEADYFLAQAREAQLRLPVIGTLSWDSALLLSGEPAALKNIVFTTPYQADSKAGTEAAEFALGFSAWVSNDEGRLEENGGSSLSSAAAALGYDGYLALLEAIKTAGDSQPKALHKALKTLSFTGAAGEVSFGETGASNKSLAYIKAYDLGSQSFEVIQTSTVSGKK